MMGESDEEEKSRKRRHKHKSEKAAKSDSDSEAERRRRKAKKKEKRKEKKRRREAPEEEEEKRERVADVPLPSGDPHSAKSANAWEKVDMGSDTRKEKFLRLMGANRQAGTSDSVHVVHNAAGENTAQMADNLEKQYKAGLDQRYQRQRGLGFSAGCSSTEPSLGEANAAPTTSSLSDLKKKFSMNFVKSSNS